MSEVAFIANAFLNGFISVFEVSVFGAMMVGIVAGMIVGLIPGLGGLIAQILLIPFALQMEPLHAYVMLLGVYAVTTQTDSIPAVLLGVPGTAAALATSLDGYPMAKRGEAGRALCASYYASIFGTLVAAGIFILFLPGLRALVLNFSSPEFFTMILLGLVMAGSLSGKSPSRGLLMGGLGLIISMIGQAPASGDTRFAGEILYLWEGMPLIPVVLGIFAIPEVVDLAIRNTTIASTNAGEKVSGIVTGFVDCLQNWWLIIKCSVIGVVTGFIPGLGGAVAEWMSYAAAVTSDKDPDSFGNGNVRGVIAPETGTASHKPGAIIPTVAFGIPGNNAMAILLVVFVMLGLRPGPDMLDQQLDLTFTMVSVVIIGNIVAALLALILQRWLVKLCFIRANLLVPFILAAMIVGASFTRLSFGDIIVFVLAGTLGYVFKHADWPRVPLVMGLIMGRIAEPYLFSTIDRYGYEWLYTRPIVMVLIVFICMVLSAPYWRKWRSQNRPQVRGGKG